jgi:hypothetical protein
MQIRDVLAAAQSPWQSPFADRLIGSIWQECLEHILVLSERHLRRVLSSLVDRPGQPAVIPRVPSEPVGSLALSGPSRPGR